MSTPSLLRSCRLIRAWLDVLLLSAVLLDTIVIGVAPVAGMLLACTDDGDGVVRTAA